MRSFSDISEILARSKEQCETNPKKALSKEEQGKVEKFKKAYFFEVEKFMLHPSNNLKNALSILILLENNKDTFLGELLIRHVAFPILGISYPLYRETEELAHPSARYDEYGRNIVKRDKFLNHINAALRTANTALADNIRLFDGIHSSLQQLKFFPSVINNLITDYVFEDVVIKSDLVRMR